MDMTPTFVPFYRTLAPGSIHAGLGFSGHGLSQTYIGGKILASTVLGVRDEWTALPVNRPEVLKAPPEPLRWAMVRTAARAMERGDERESHGRTRGIFNELAGGAPLWIRDRLRAQ
jgi:hypothetical protein